MATYDDGSPARGATIAITDLETSKQVDIIVADDAGRYQAAIAPGKYALAATAEHGFAWVKSQDVPFVHGQLAVSRACHPLVGHADGDAASTRVYLERQSLSQGDTFVAPVRRDRSFTFCLPEGQYRAYMEGDTLSVSMKVELPAAAPLRIRGIARRQIEAAPPRTDRLRADLDGLVAAITDSRSTIIGLGEATHGTAEFVSAREQLTLELIRRAGVRLLLFEFDAIASAPLDDYINGGDVDLEKAVAKLGFWITDTHEFLQLLRDLRAYNVTATDKVHLWGIDLQNTTLPIEVLTASSNELNITADDQAVLAGLGKRGKGVRELSTAQRAGIDALLTRLAAPRGTTKHDILLAVAARSLAMQLDYWTGDMETWFLKRRDIGMARLATFLVAQSGAPRACLWAHDGHISKDPNEYVLGHHLATSQYPYYAVGFYLYQGAARAVDTAGKIGVISFPIPRAPVYTVEAAVMAASGEPSIAWLALSNLPRPLRSWLDTPRLTRELGAVYFGEDRMMTLRSIPAAFDAVVVIHTGHDSTPTPTGVRIFKR